MPITARASPVPRWSRGRVRGRGRGRPSAIAASAAVTSSRLARPVRSRAAMRSSSRRFHATTSSVAPGRAGARPVRRARAPSSAPGRLRSSGRGSGWRRARRPGPRPTASAGRPRSRGPDRRSTSRSSTRRTRSGSADWATRLVAGEVVTGGGPRRARRGRAIALPPDHGGGQVGGDHDLGHPPSLQTESGRGRPRTLEGVARIRIGLCQLNTVVGDLDGNVERILAAYDEAEAAGCDVAVFPELAITGYPPEDLVLKPGFVAANRAALDKVAARTGRCAAVVGFVDAGPRPPQRGRGVRGRHGRRHVPQAPPAQLRGVRRAALLRPRHRPLTLFEIAGGAGRRRDLRGRVERRRHRSPPSRPAAPSSWSSPTARPYFEGRHAERERMVATRAEDAHCHIVYVNQVGGQDELIFDGASFVVDDDGELLHRMPQLRAGVDVVDLDVRPVFRTRLLDPRGRDTAPALPVVPVSSAVADHPGEPRLPPCSHCSRRSTRCTTRWCSPRATTSPRTASPTSCSGSPAASTPRSSPSSPPTPSAPSTCTPCRCRAATRPTAR